MYIQSVPPGAARWIQWQQCKFGTIGLNVAKIYSAKSMLVRACVAKYL